MTGRLLWLTAAAAIGLSRLMFGAVWANYRVRRFPPMVASGVYFIAALTVALRALEDLAGEAPITSLPRRIRVSLHNPY